MFLGKTCHAYIFSYTIRNFMLCLVFIAHFSSYRKKNLVACFYPVNENRQQQNTYIKAKAYDNDES